MREAHGLVPLLNANAGQVDALRRLKCAVEQIVGSPQQIAESIDRERSALRRGGVYANSRDDALRLRDARALRGPVAQRENLRSFLSGDDALKVRCPAPARFRRRALSA